MLAEVENHISYWEWLLLILSFALGLSAPIGTTVLGSVAISNIRNSNGRLCGMPLALADALFYPLLALGIAIFAFTHALISAMPLVFAPAQAVLLSVMLTLPIASVIDLVVVLAAWHMVRK